MHADGTLNPHPRASQLFPPPAVADWARIHPEGGRPHNQTGAELHPRAQTLVWNRCPGEWIIQCGRPSPGSVERPKRPLWHPHLVGRRMAGVGGLYRATPVWLLPPRRGRPGLARAHGFLPRALGFLARARSFLCSSRGFRGGDQGSLWPRDPASCRLGLSLIYRHSSSWSISKPRTPVLGLSASARRCCCSVGSLLLSRSFGRTRF